ncbi:hypothetical protein GCM10010329_20220 [Streptomyces spiroverticillatus]|uniref:Uncharacterized protein n=1 Tax=Streptomyces finlayi TaxID=67296 RepID=A0A919C8C7_9ACTN|nr:hypothetical protein [Streptomyces finlayi]GGZ98620.1 hypothetical protein GCM10010329_20220 [Streptomyces spiroverticillatus]GHC83495.1 hypothetical protein GCM10010334_12660 [Streptomyces finlayi]
MSPWRASGPGIALAAGLGLVATLAVAAPAQSAALPMAPVAGGHEPATGDWGEVVETKDGVQAHAWVARLQGLGGVSDAPVLDAHHPALPGQPAEQNSGYEVTPLATKDGFPIGRESAAYSRALGNQIAASTGFDKAASKPGAAFAEAGAISIDIGVPYVGSPGSGTQLSTVGIHAEGVSATATALPGKPVDFSGSASRAYFSVLGEKTVTVPKLWEVNYGVRIPADYSRPVFALATTNEQVTTDVKGRPTLDADEQYTYDAEATSGYANAVHLSILGANVTDVTLGHAGVLRDAKKTDGLSKTKATRTGAGVSAR